MLPNVNVAKSTDALIDYHLGKTNHQPTGYRITAVQSGLMFCALAGLLYYVPASEYRAKSSEERTLNIMGTCYMSVLICYVSADMFFRMHLEKQWPDRDLAGIVGAPLKSNEFWWQNLIIGACAAISAIPFASTAYTYPPAGIHPDVLKVYLVYVLLAEAVLHFLPVKLTLDHPFYGTLPRKAIQLWHCVRQQQKSPDELWQIQQEKDVKSSREQLEKRIKEASDVLLASFIPSLGQLDIAKLTQFLDETSANKFTILFFCEPAAAKPFPVIVENTARFLGAMTVLGSCLGFAANPLLLFIDWTSSWWQALLCLTFPLYFFGLLMIYFGDEYGKRILTDLSLFAENIYLLRQGGALKLPLIYRLYPITMTGMIMLNIFLLVYSPAAAEQMMELAFKKVAPSGVMTMLTAFAKAGMFILAWYAPLDFQQLMLKYWTQYRRTGGPHEIVLLAANLQTLAEDMLQLNPENVADIENRIGERLSPKTENNLPRNWAGFWDYFKSLKGNAQSLYQDEQKVKLLEKEMVTGSF